MITHSLFSVFCLDDIQHPKEFLNTLDGCLELRRKVFQIEFHQPRYVDRDGLDHDVQSMHHFAVVLKARSSILIGTARLYCPRKNPKRIARLERVAVTSEYRRMGVGRLLVATVEEFSRIRGVTRIMLKTPGSSHTFFLKMGYVIGGRDPMDISMHKHV